MIGSDPTKVIAAWGDGDVITYHGLENVAQAQEYLFASAAEFNTDPLAKITNNSNISYVDVVAVSEVRCWYGEGD